MPSPYQPDPIPTARRGGKTTEVLVKLNSVVSLPTTALINRRSIEIQNLGPNPIYVTVDGTDPVATKARSIAATGGVWSLDVSSEITIKAIAGTADQVTGAATIVTELS